MLKMILKDLRLSPLRSILTSVSMLVGIIAMLGSVLVGTLGREYLISVNAQVYGWSPTYSFVITESDFHDRNKMEQLFQRFEAIDDVAAVTFSMGEDIRFAPMKDLTPIPPNDVYQNLMAFDLVCTTEAFTDDHADQAQSNIDFHHTQDERHGRRKDNLCQFVFFCAAEGADEFQFFRVSFAEAGVEIDD